MLFAGQKVLIGKNCALGLDQVSSMAFGRILKTKGTVFPNTDQPRPTNNMITIVFNFSYGIAVKGPKNVCYMSAKKEQHHSVFCSPVH